MNLIWSQVDLLAFQEITDAFGRKDTDGMFCNKTMKNGMVPFIFKLLAGRWFFLFLNIVSVYFSMVGVLFLLHHLGGCVIWGPDGIEELNDVCSSISILLIALGVIMESRDVFLRISRTAEDDWQVRLNHMAEDFGVGLLLFGLFIEGAVIVLELPDLMFSSKGREFTSYLVALFLIIVSVLISVSFIIAFLRTYLINPDKVNTFASSDKPNK